MDEILDEFERDRLQRPTLLTVLCILSFVGGTWLILTNIYSYISAPTTVQRMAVARNVVINDSARQAADSAAGKGNRKGRGLFGQKIMLSLTKTMTVENIRKSAIGSILAAMLTLSGAILMWFLRRRGFYLYSAGVIVAICVPLYINGLTMASMALVFVSGFFGLIFIALYALNLKSLR